MKIQLTKNQVRGLLTSLFVSITLFRDERNITRARKLYDRIKKQYEECLKNVL